MYGDLSFTLFGTVASDPELTTLTNGTPRLTISVAVNVPFKKEDGTFDEKTTWVRLALFGKATERKSVSWIKKGTTLFARGVVTSYKYETSEGKALTMFNFRPDVLRPMNVVRNDSPADPGFPAGTDEYDSEAFG